MGYDGYDMIGYEGEGLTHRERAEALVARLGLPPRFRGIASELTAAFEEVQEAAENDVKGRVADAAQDLVELLRDLGVLHRDGDDE